MGWTKDQEKAIYESGQNIIVSAGAGSGKTAVLSERILEKVKNLFLYGPEQRSLIYRPKEIATSKGIPLLHELIEPDTSTTAIPFSSLPL